VAKFIVLYQLQIPGNIHIAKQQLSFVLIVHRWKHKA